MTDNVYDIQTSMTDNELENLNKDIDYVEATLTTYNELGNGTDFYCRLYHWLHKLKEFELQRRLHKESVNGK